MIQQDISRPTIAPATAPTKRKARKPLTRELLETVLLTALLIGIVKFSVQDFMVQGTSMVPTLQNDEYILVDKVTYPLLHPPRHGDIVVFIAPPDHSKDYIKRVIGLPGDTVALRPVHGVNRVFVDGRMLNEPYIAAAPDVTSFAFEGCANPQGCSYKVKRDELFVMGDNRNESYDSRAWGPLPMKNLIGRALVAYWPLSHAALLPGQYSYAK